MIGQPLWRNARQAERHDMKTTVIAAAFAVTLCTAAHAQDRRDPWGDATVSRAGEEAKADERFDAMDTNHDGSLSADEMAAGAQSQRGPGGGGMRRADADGDGKVSKAEYLAAQLRRFDMQDADKDGQLTKVERDAARAQRMQGGGWGGPPPGSE